MKKSTKMIIACVLLFVIFVVIIYFLVIKGNKGNPSNNTVTGIGNYTKIGEPYKDPNGVVIELDSLKSDHCIKNICVSITKISCNDSRGRIFYTIKNIGSDKTSGIIHLSFPEKEIKISYENLEVESVYESSYIYKNSNLKQVTDFTFDVE